MNTVENVSAAAPAVGGAISVAPTGTALPTSATAELAAAFKSLGYVSEDGVKNNNTPSSDVVKAWGGDEVLRQTANKEDTFQYTLIEIMNIDVLKEVYGSDNVSGTLATGITIKANDDEMEAHVVVIDMILRNGALKRVVIPRATVTAVGEITYSETGAVGYQTTIKAAKDSSGNRHYEYIIAAPSDDSDD